MSGDLEDVVRHYPLSNRQGQPSSVTPWVVDQHATLLG
jgi:hypothetical protein